MRAWLAFGVGLLLVLATLLAVRAVAPPAAAPAAPAVTGPVTDPAVPAAPEADRAGLSREEWRRRHAALQAQASRGGVDLLLLGDGAVEDWPTAGKSSWERLSRNRRAAAFGIAGDQTQQLLWRLANGETKGLQPRGVILLIGNANLRQPGATPVDVNRGVGEVVQAVRALFPKANLMVLGLLPDGRAARDPLRTAVSETNNLVARALMNGRVIYHDAGLNFLAPNGAWDPAMITDNLRLSESAYERLARDLEPMIGTLLAP